MDQPPPPRNSHRCFTQKDPCRLGKNRFLREAWFGGMLQCIGGVRWQGKPDLDGFHSTEAFTMKVFRLRYLVYLRYAMSIWGIFKLIYHEDKVENTSDRNSIPCQLLSYMSTLTIHHLLPTSTIISWFGAILLFGGRYRTNTCQNKLRSITFLQFPSHPQGPKSQKLSKTTVPWKRWW